MFFIISIITKIEKKIGTEVFKNIVLFVKESLSYKKYTFVLIIRYRWEVKKVNKVSVYFHTLISHKRGEINLKTVQTLGSHLNPGIF